MKNLFWKSLELGRFRDGRTRLFIEFSDDREKNFKVGEWTPRWSEVSALVAALVEVERKNCDESEYLEKLQQLFGRISSRVRSATNARIIIGQLREYELIGGTAYAEIQTGEMIGKRFVPIDKERVALGIPLTDAEVRSLLTTQTLCSWILWNNFVIQKSPIASAMGPKQNRVYGERQIALNPA